jgi:hypothetical protein
MKQSDDQSMPLHTTFGNHHKKFILWSMKKLARAPKMHMELLHYYDLAMTPTPTTWKNVQS